MNAPRETIPALSRGLRILDHLVQTGAPRRFRDIRRACDDIGDASLNRLLRSLLNDGFIRKNKNGAYVLGERIDLWNRQLRERHTLMERIRTATDGLAEDTGESAAFALLEEDRVIIQRHRTREDSIAVIQRGAVLHFEPDHAAAVAVLAGCAPGRRRELLAGPYSVAENAERFEQAASVIHNDGIYHDESRARPGISRLAVACVLPSGPAALFLCLPTPVLRQRMTYLSRCLHQRASMFTADV